MDILELVDLLLIVNNNTISYLILLSTDHSILYYLLSSSTSDNTNRWVTRPCGYPYTALNIHSDGSSMNKYDMH